MHQNKQRLFCMLLVIPTLTLNINCVIKPMTAQDMVGEQQKQPALYFKKKGDLFEFNASAETKGKIDVIPTEYGAAEYHAEFESIGNAEINASQGSVISAMDAQRMASFTFALEATRSNQQFWGSVVHDAVELGKVILPELLRSPSTGTVNPNDQDNLSTVINELRLLRQTMNERNTP